MPTSTEHWLDFIEVATVHGSDVLRCPCQVRLCAWAADAGDGTLKTMTSVLSLSGLVLGVVVLLLDEVLPSRLLQSMSALALVSRKPPTTAVGCIGV